MSGCFLFVSVLLQRLHFKKNCFFYITFLLEGLCLNCFVSHQSKRRRMPTQTQSFSPWETMTVPLGSTGERKWPGLGAPYLYSSPFLALYQNLAQIWPPSLGWSSHFSDDPLIIQIHSQEMEEVLPVWTPIFKHLFVIVYSCFWDIWGFMRV